MVNNLNNQISNLQELNLRKEIHDKHRVGLGLNLMAEGNFKLKKRKTKPINPRENLEKQN